MRTRHQPGFRGSPRRSQRGECSVANPAYVSFQTAWVSDRSLCYLTSGKPVVVQDTVPAPSSRMERGSFASTPWRRRAEAIALINRDYARHCRAAREVAQHTSTAAPCCRSTRSGVAATPRSCSFSWSGQRLHQPIDDLGAVSPRGCGCDVCRQCGRTVRQPSTCADRCTDTSI